MRDLYLLRGVMGLGLLVGGQYSCSECVLLFLSLTLDFKANHCIWYLELVSAFQASYPVTAAAKRDGSKRLPQTLLKSAPKDAVVGIPQTKIKIGALWLRKETMVIHPQTFYFP